MPPQRMRAECPGAFSTLTWIENRPTAQLYQVATYYVCIDGR